MKLPIMKIFESTGNIIDEIFTSDEERLNAQAQADKIVTQSNNAQVELNKIEANSKSMFIAGWRPFIGWTCGLAIAYHFILRDLITYILVLFRVNIPALPNLEMEQLITITLGMLGLGAVRTYEKIQGIQTNKIEKRRKQQKRNKRS